MGGHGNKIYEYIKEYLQISKEEYAYIWNELIFKEKSHRNKFNGIWSKIAFQEFISRNINGVLSKNETSSAVSAAKSTAMSLLIFCLDAIAGDVYIDFYSWINRHHKQENYSANQLHNLYEEYISENGVMKGFVKLFEGMLYLKLVNNYTLFFTRKAEGIDKLSQQQRSAIMKEVRQKWEASTDIEKSHAIGTYYYKLHRNLFIHSGQTPITGPIDLGDPFVHERDSMYYAVAFYPEIGLVAGEILGDELDHLDKLLKLSLARKIESMLKQASLQ